ncbi:MAG TPA: multiheme c-type cytochrome [Chthoniobacterales bacterium]|nr:multiheme c-type cytochrome [Chthoniobacterales bacterium]
MRWCLRSRPWCKTVSLGGWFGGGGGGGPALKCLVSAVLLFGGTEISPGAAEQIPPERAGQFVGSAGCKSSSCHGGAGEKRSQFLTWSQQDFHFRAFAVLVNARSARMADTLRIGDAQSSARCTICHSPFQSVESARLTTPDQRDQGVSCESCHNAASSWLRGHTRPDWSYATRVSAGMRDLQNLYVRANTCVACHQNLDTDILAAGHPELRFELDGQSVAEPKHWRDEPGTGAKAWLVGQAVALREMSWALGRSENPDDQSVAQWNGLVWLLGKVTAGQRRLRLLDFPNGPLVRASFIDMQGRADSFARSVAETSLGDNFARDTLNSLLNLDAEFQQAKEPDKIMVRRAERLVPAVIRLADAAGMDSDAAPRPERIQLIEALPVDAGFDRGRFVKALAVYRESLTKLPAGQ